MLTPWKKRRLMRRVFREEQRVLEEAKTLEARMTSADPSWKHLALHLHRLDLLLQRLQPRARLDYISLALRIGVATVFFLVMIGPAYQYFRGTFLQPSIVSVSQGIGEIKTTRFVPESRPEESSFARIEENGRNGPYTIFHQAEDVGLAVGLIPHAVSVTAYWLSGTQKSDLALFRRELDHDSLRPIGATTTIWGDDRFFGAAVSASSNSTTAIIVSIKQEKGFRFRLQRFSEQGNPLGERVEFSSVAGETGVVQLFPWNDRFVVLTTVAPKMGDPFAYQATMMRVFDSMLKEVWSAKLPVETMHISEFPSFFPLNDMMGNFIILASTQSLIRGKTQIGDEIYAMEFNRRGEPTRYYRLTSNGRKHDFMISDAFVYDTLGWKFFSAHEMNAPAWDASHAPSGYPDGAARARVRVYDKNFEQAGGFGIFDGPPVGKDDKKIGAAHTRITHIGRRLYALYDLVIIDDPEQKERNILRELQIISIDLSR